MKVDYTVSFLSLIIHVFNLTSNSGCYTMEWLRKFGGQCYASNCVFPKGLVAARGFLKRMDMQK